MIRPFLMWPDPRLRQRAEPVDEITDEIRTLWDDMLETMYAMPGIGLAAPQIGVMRRVAVVDVGDGAHTALRMANPEIITASPDFGDWDEGSPNLPGVSASISRPRAASIRYMDGAGLLVRVDLENLWARSALHQIDHLEGRMYFDRLSKVKRDMLLRKAKKAKT